MSAELELHEIVKDYLHKLEALYEVVPYQMGMAAFLAQKSQKKHKDFLEKNAEKIKYEHGLSKYELNFKDVKRSTRLSSKSDRSSTVLEILPKNFLVSFVSEYDSFLGKLINKLLRLRPEIIDSKEKSVTLSELMVLNSIEAAQDKIFTQEIESILRASHSDQFAWMEKAFSIPLRKGLHSWPTFIELTERRNLFVHCDGIISQQYINVCNKHDVKLSDEIVVGDSLKADIKYLKQSYEALYEIGLKLSQVLWRKLSPKDVEKADASLSDLTYEILIDGNYELAKNLLDFACCTLKKWNSESTRLTYVINRVIAYKFSGDIKKAKSILGSEDWSAVGDNYKLCVAVLGDDYHKAKKIMIRIGKDGIVSEVDYAEWPCFKDFRMSDEFAAGFNEVFGYEPVVIEEIGFEEDDVEDMRELQEADYDDDNDNDNGH